MNGATVGKGIYEFCKKKQINVNKGDFFFNVVGNVYRYIQGYAAYTA